MANMAAREQLMLELMNRARMDPAGEAARLDVTLSSGQAAPVQVLAGHDGLRSAAYSHSGWMLNNDIFSSTQTAGTPGFSGANPLLRMQAYGYQVSGRYAFGENISWVGHTTVTPDFTQSIINQHKTLFESATSRARILNAEFQEVGIGQQAGNFINGGDTYITSMITQDFIRSGAKVFITGVIYNDAGGVADFYDVGEGVASKKVKVSGAPDDISGAGGGYELQFSSTGVKRVTFDLATDLVLDVALGTTNVKVDAVNGREIWTNGSVQSQSSAIKEIHALGVSPLLLIGSGTSEKIFGNKAANTLMGQGGSDTITGGAGKDSIDGGAGKDMLTGGSSADRFVFSSASHSSVSAPDTITDFGDSGADRIDLRGLYSGTLTYRDESSITGANQVSVTRSGADVIVHVNLDSDRTDEMRIVLKNTSLGSMTAGDFML